MASPQRQAFVQLGEEPASNAAHGWYRHGFWEFVTSAGVRGRDRVVLCEADPERLSVLRALWADWPDVTFHQLAFETRESASPTVDFFSAAVDPGGTAVFSADLRLVRNHSPNGELTTTAVPCEPLHDFLAGVAAEAPIALVSVDAGNDRPRVLEDVSWTSLPCAAVSVSWPDSALTPVDSLDRVLRQSGFRPAGRGWGEAGSSRMYRRASSPGTLLAAATAQARVRSGQAIDRVRTALPDRVGRVAIGRRVQRAVDRRYTHADVFDPSYGLPLTVVGRAEVQRAVAPLTVDGVTEWQVSLQNEDSIPDLAAACWDRHGVWPISFNYPAPWPGHDGVPSESLSPIVPGFPYSFVDHEEYLRTYNRARLAVTHRKAGWDCFRHVEILASGSVPLFVDASGIPEYSMIHYPRRALGEVADAAMRAGGVPDQQTRADFQAYFQQHLTSRSMAEYMLAVSELADAERVLFVDQQHPGISDYQSTLALVGLKQILGANVRPLFPAEWLYEDWEGVTGHLYGRGFGYTRVLPAEARSAAERQGITDSSLSSVRPQDFDLVVVGSVMRNLPMAQELLKRFPASRTIWIHGEDSPPTIHEARFLRTSGTKVFVRAIESRGPGSPPTMRLAR